MLISDMYKEYSLLGITIRLRFTIVQYGKDFKKEEFKTDGFEKVDHYDYDIVEHSIAECMQGDYDENAYLQTVELKNDKQNMYQYMLEDKYSDFTFGFSTDSAFYMFNNKENAFYEYTR